MKNQIKKERPFGISVISVINIIAGSIMLVAGSSSNIVNQKDLLFFLGAFGLSVGIGLFCLKSWARYAAVLGYIVNIYFAVTTLNPIAGGVSIWILSYLFSDKVEVAFSSTIEEKEETVSENHKLVSSAG